MNISDAVERVRAVVDHDHAAALLDAYFDPDGPFAGRTFLDLSPSDPGQVMPSDLLAVTLLDVPFRPPAVRSLLEDRQPSIFFDWLTAVETTVAVDELQEFHEGDPAHDRAAEAWRALRTLVGVGPVIAGKLMARKRPRLIPIVDEVVIRIVAAPPGAYWTVFHAAVRDGTIARSLAELSRAHGGLPGLRLLDALIWMLGSNSRNAQAARVAAGMAEQPWRP